MKKTYVALLTLVLAFVLVAGAAMAEVRTTGNVNLRTGPGLDYEIVGSVEPDTELEYLDRVSTDERGVDWYLVEYKKGESWISSRYSELIGEIAAPAVDYDPVAAADWVEVSEYYLCDLEESAEQLGLTNYEEVSSEVPYQYSDDALTIASYQVIEYIGLHGAGYKLFGAACGMPVEEAMDCLTEAGLIFYCDNNDVVVFEHPTNERSVIDCEGFDSCINLEYRDGVVVSIDWSTYTG